jgi:hypothetical protein
MEQKGKPSTVRTRVEHDLYEKIQDLAVRFGLTESDITRMALREFITANYGQENLQIKPVVRIAPASVTPSRTRP